MEIPVSQVRNSSKPKVTLFNFLRYSNSRTHIRHKYVYVNSSSCSKMKHQGFLTRVKARAFDMGTYGSFG